MLDVPHLRQLRSWSCGPACVRMILRYYGEDVSEAELIDELGATEQGGTSPAAITLFANRRRLMRLSGHLRMRDLRASVNAGSPAIVAYQAWGPPKTDYSTCYDHGHYAVVIGADDRRITLCDPSSKRPRRHFKTEEFLSRWRDIDSTGRIYLRWGCSVGPKHRS